ncbi:hypothetical protein B0H66DRAFT_558107 [Apodospora peruviana]|uniref:Uncharacterized protein n=1 Tax=Apodospora peruviana TaxID=516989 RepID=A0AAE0M4H3_9PEZI|nr:hypothetical protein B0H66DRAFT_558107 [Apodospora peruviana]
MAASPSGFALRMNDTCQGKEVDCGNTVSPYRVCCPEASFCPSQYSVDSCPTASSCTESLVAEPRCANGTWNLNDNKGYFCCLQGMVGY